MHETSRLRTLALFLGLCGACSGDSTAHDGMDAGKQDGGDNPTDMAGKGSDGAGRGSEATKPVVYMIPDSGGSVAVPGANGKPLDFTFPASVAGMEITLTPSSATSIGWSEGQFSEVVKLEPDGSKFSEPIIVRPPNGELIALSFPQSSEKTAPEGLPLAPNGDGILVSHFSTLAFVQPNNFCAQEYKVAADSESQEHCTNDEFPQYITLSCNGAEFCLSVEVSCCAAKGATTCHPGDDSLKLAFKTTTDTASGKYPYCAPNRDGSAGTGGMSAAAGMDAVTGTGGMSAAPNTGTGGTSAAAGTGTGGTSAAAGSDAAAGSPGTGSTDSGGNGSPEGRAGSGGSGDRAPDAGYSGSAGQGADDADGGIGDDPCWHPCTCEGGKNGTFICGAGVYECNCGGPSTGGSGGGGYAGSSAEVPDGGVSDGGVPNGGASDGGASDGGAEYDPCGHPCSCGPGKPGTFICIQEADIHECYCDGTGTGGSGGGGSDGGAEIPDAGQTYPCGTTCKCDDGTTALFVCQDDFHGCSCSDSGAGGAGGSRDAGYSDSGTTGAPDAGPVEQPDCVNGPMLPCLCKSGPGQQACIGKDTYGDCICLSDI